MAQQNPQNYGGKQSGGGNKPPRSLVVESTVVGSPKRQPDGVSFKAHVRCITSGPIRGVSFRFLVNGQTVNQGNFVSLGGDGGKIAEADLLLKGEETVITLELRDDQRRLHSFTVSTMKLPEPKKPEGLLLLRGSSLNRDGSEFTVTIVAMDDSGKFPASRQYFYTDTDEGGNTIPYYGVAASDTPGGEITGVNTITFRVFSAPRTITLFLLEKPQEVLKVEIPGKRQEVPKPEEPPIPGTNFLREVIRAVTKGRRTARGK